MHGRAGAADARLVHIKRTLYLQAACRRRLTVQCGAARLCRSPGRAMTAVSALRSRSAKASRSRRASASTSESSFTHRAQPNVASLWVLCNSSISVLQLLRGRIVDTAADDKRVFLLYA